MARPNLARTWALCVAMGILAGACGPAAAPAPSDSAAPSELAAVPTPTPAPTPTPRPTPIPRPTPTPAPTPIPLEPGTYGSVELEPSISYTLPSGWEQYADTRTWFETSPKGAHYSTIAIFVDPKPARLTTGCVALEDETVGPKASDLVAWLAEHPALTTSKPKSATVAGLPGKVVDVALDPSWTDDCPWDPGRPATSLLLFGDEGTDIWPAAAEQDLRLYIADLPDGRRFVIDIDHFYGWDLEKFRDAATPIVESMSITSLPKPTPPTIAAGTTGKVRLPEYGLTITLPKGWETMDLKAEDVKAVFAQLPADMLPAGLADRVASLIAMGLVFWAFDFEPANLGANTSIIALPQPITESMLLLTAKMAAAQIPHATHVKTTEISIDGQRVVRIDLELTAEVGGSTTTMIETQLYIPRSGTALVITIAIPKGGQLKDRDSIVKSIRLD